MPAQEVHSERLREFLGRIGMSPEVVEWRYFDSAFNRGRNRGFVWLRQNRIEGMIGLIPFEVGDGKRRRDVEWFCDWVLADPGKSLGMGVVILKRAIESNGALACLGGNEKTRKLMPRIATRTVPDAGLSLHLALRSGAVLRLLERRSPMFRVPKPRISYMIPLRWMPKRMGRSDVTTQAGVAPQIAPLVELRQGNGWYPHYDVEYVDWQIGRSPLLLSATSYSRGVGDPLAAALYWRPRAFSDFWRLALWWNKEHPERLSSVIDEAISRVYQDHGMGISVIVSHLDSDLIAILKAHGFRAGGIRRSLYLCTAAPTEPLEELKGLSYLDVDTGYRF
jgi:hypothetical protein